MNPPATGPGSTPYHPGARYQGGLIDAAAHLGARLYTHEKIIAGQMRQRQLDHILVPSEHAPHLRRVWADVGCPASDHLPLWAEFELPGAGQSCPAWP